MNDRKENQRERYLRGAKKFEQKREHLAQKKRRAASRERGSELDWPDSARGRVVRVVEVLRTEVRVRDGDVERAALVAPSARGAGGLAVGDEVALTGDFDDPTATLRVTERGPRRTALVRRRPGHGAATKVLAVNVDLGLVVLAPRREGLSLGFLERAVAALTAGGIEPRIVVTKVDLQDAVRRAQLDDALAPWTRQGHVVARVSAVTGEGIADLRAALAGRVSVLLGHSGVGKSTLVNALDPAAGQFVGAVRQADGRGRHTTTSARLIPFVAGGGLVDTPGVRQLVPDGVEVAALAAGLPDLAPYLGRCRFQDCTHGLEPGCAVLEAAASDGRVAQALRRLQRLIDSIEAE
ncbi:MAG: ribosome small subunit-dependent GTPase A [Planctomycetota bacterium]